MSVKFTDNTDKFLDDFRRGAIVGVGKGAVLLETNVRKNTPVLTGNLRGSIAWDERVRETGSGFSAKTGTNVEYAEFVEFGTEKQAPRAMFRKGADESGNGILSLIKKNLPK